MHIQEDAFILEIRDPETGRRCRAARKAPSTSPRSTNTARRRSASTSNDISAIAPGTCACGSTLHRLERIFGRNDNMVKLRGVNVFPEAIGVVVAEDKRTNGEFFCIVERVGETRTDEMRVMVELKDQKADPIVFKSELERRLREVLGVRVLVEPVGLKELDQFTGTSQVTKIKRLLDKRKSLQS